MGTSINEYGATHNKFCHVSKDDRIKFLAVISMDVDLAFKKIVEAVCPNANKNGQGLT